MGHVDFLETIEARGGSYTLRGICDEEFAPVYEAFRENFRVEEELGAACSVVIDGETVVDLWGGWARADRSVDWDEHTTVCMMSVAKGVTGICFNMLIDRGLVDPDARVATYWPELAQNGKQDITVRMILYTKGADNALVDTETLSDEQLDRLEEHFQRLARVLQKDQRPPAKVRAVPLRHRAKTQDENGKSQQSSNGKQASSSGRG